jgi:transcriptional regulator with XRE-family HTH domain
MISKEEFKRRLKEMGLTQVELSRRLGKKPSWLNRKISGARNMKCDELLRICELTGIPPTELLGFQMPEESPEIAEKKISRELAAFLSDRMVDDIVRIKKELAKKK